MYKNLREFLSRLEQAGELVRIAAPVDPVLEIAEITERMARSPGGGKALWFEQSGTAFPVVTNLFGSDRRMALALGVENLDEITARIDLLLRQLFPIRGGLADKLRMLPLLGEMARWLPKQVKGRGACQEVILTGDRVRLSDLPILKCRPHDGGRFVTLPLVHTADPDTGARNVGMYRMQVFSETTAGMHWQLHKTGERHYQACKRRGERMSVSISLGGDPACTYAATAPMPDNMDEYLLAGFIRRRPVRLVKCITNDLYVPADCDFVIEGYVDPAEAKVTEGPFGDHTGFYSLEDDYPLFHVTAITHRRDALYPATIVGIPPQEDCYIARATERIFLAPIRLALQPEICDLWLPAPGVAHNLAVVNMEKSYPGQAFKVANSLWSAGQMMFSKFLLIVSCETDIRTPGVLCSLLRQAHIPDDVLITKGVLDMLDHAAATPGFGGKLALDLTEYTPQTDALPEENNPRNWGVFVVYAAPESAMPNIPALLQRERAEACRFVVVVDTAAQQLTPEELLWYAAGNTDVARDIRMAEGRIVIDARSKIHGPPPFPARWPNPVIAAPETIALVDRRWSEYGFSEPIDSPSLRYIPLLHSEKADV